MAAPVSVVRATWSVGLLVVPVKYPVTHRMMPASTTPMATATEAISRGSPPCVARPAVPPVRSAKDDGR